MNLHPAIKADTLKPGQEPVLIEGLNVVEAAGYEIQGDVVILKEQLEPSARSSRCAPTRRRSASSPIRCGRRG